MCGCNNGCNRGCSRFNNGYDNEVYNNYNGYNFGTPDGVVFLNHNADRRCCENRCARQYCRCVRNCRCGCNNNNWNY